MDLEDASVIHASYKKVAQIEFKAYCARMAEKDILSQTTLASVVTLLGPNLYHRDTFGKT